MSIDRIAPPSGSTYVLGHSNTEIERLLLQGRLHNDFTEHALCLAGLRPGMRVLDVGCGPGDVSFLAARLVGPTGTVVGVDSAAGIVEFARTIAADRGVNNVRFQTTSIADIALDEPVDAVIGRLILMHLPDPVEALRQLAATIRPGGFIAFCESDSTAVRTIPDLPLWQAVKDAAVKAFAGAGLDPNFGTTLRTLFCQAGLNAPRLTLGAPIGAAVDDDIMALVVETWRSLLPVAERMGVLSPELADLDNLARRLREEAAAADATAVMPAMICASSRV
ncbi:class I SAM-dependent methyltransferase [Mycobacterium sp. 1465703.0]|uniref:class I SAM-dependent methyltransferase n=1 Tax=Mycobacterium sp. 1465703.0 TaxID=1834078 RepID=UPI0007FD2B12|nr:class I SAM-dependent methyltransferase [Mycobacterium sp. 1465703.0]OBI99810.1 methylase [Mycobacterium sp. 1465703.0]